MVKLDENVLYLKSGPIFSLQVTVAVPIGQQSEIVIKMVNDNPATHRPTKAEQMLFARLRKIHGLPETRSLQVSIDRLPVSPATLERHVGSRLNLAGLFNFHYWNK